MNLGHFGGVIELSALLEKADAQTLGVVFFDTDEGEGHFSPVLGRNGENVLMPYLLEGDMLFDELLGRWSADGICRQALLVKG